MAVAIRVAFQNFPRIQAKIHALKNAGEDLSPAFELCGPYMLRSVDKNFDAGGRPEKWHEGKKMSGKTLIKNSTLKQSITYKASRGGLTVSTNVPYAAIHQLGGKIRAHTVSPKPGGVLAFMVHGNMVFTRKPVRIPEVTMPARPFLVVQDEDWLVMNRILMDHFKRGWN
jgi:phage gpG-like protein